MTQSMIFTTETNTTTRPRPDASIRVKAYKEGSTQEAGYIRVELLEFHPDLDERLKFRGYALVRPCKELLRPEHAHIYRMCGEGFLEEPYISVNEVFIHEADREEMMKWCWQELHRRKQYTALVIHPQLVPFPMFRKGVRVIVLEYKDSQFDTVEAHQAGQLATTYSQSSPGAMTQVTFDKPELNRGFKCIGMPSIALREVKDGNPPLSQRTQAEQERPTPGPHSPESPNYDCFDNDL